MKSRNYFKILVPLVAVLFLFATGGCNKEKVPTGRLKLHMHTYINDEEVDSAGKLYPDANGRLMALTTAQFYLSNISIKSTDGNWYTVPGAYVIKRMEAEDYTVGNVPVGDYTDIRFNVGLDSATNASEPASHSTTGADSALSTNELGMWFGWTWHGYMFMNLIGSVDISVAKDGSNVVPFSYQIGGNEHLKEITMPLTSFSVMADRASEVHLNCDFAKLLQNIDMTVEANRTTDTYAINVGTATLVTDSIPAMFKYE